MLATNWKGVWVYLRADSLVYADLVMLAKSTDLGKSILDTNKENLYWMNSHYLELKIFLEKIESCPEMLFEQDLTVKLDCMEMSQKPIIVFIRSH